MSRIFLTAILVWMPALASAQPVAEPALKAAFLYNFAKFTEWPADALGAGAPLVVCTTDAAVFDALAKTTAGRSIEQHQIEVRGVDVDSPTLRACHVLYVSDLDAKRTARMLEALKGAPVLTVGDRDEFVKLGGVARFFVEDRQMRFAINVESARRGRLQLSSKLLSLARIM